MWLRGGDVYNDAAEIRGTLYVQMYKCCGGRKWPIVGIICLIHLFACTLPLIICFRPE